MVAMPDQDTIAQEVYEGVVRRRNKRRRYLGMSEIGGPCDRALWYGVRGFPPAPKEGRIIRIFEAGNDVETRVVRDLVDAGYRIDDAQAEFSDFDGLFRGHCDGIIRGITQRPHILEVKSANDAKFKAFKTKGVAKVQPKYWGQVQCYMGYADLDRALFVIDNKNTSEIHTERVHFVRADFETLRARALAILCASDPPDRAFKQEAMDCRWCDHRITCWDEAVMSDDEKVCGTCFYVRVGIEITSRPWRHWCAHPDHPVRIEQWGLGCPDYVYMWQKVAPGQPAWPDPIDHEALKAMANGQTG